MRVIDFVDVISDACMDIQYYLNIFEQKGQQIDAEDKLFIKSLSPSDSKHLIPNPKTYDLSPNCFRASNVSRDGSKDTLIRRVYIRTCKLFCILYECMVIININDGNTSKYCTYYSFCKKTILFSAGEDEEIMAKSCEIMNKTEPNDDYRSTVRRVRKIN